jgi:hypothetical protein
VINRREFMGAAIGAAIAAQAMANEGKPMNTENTVFELRQYTLHGGQRDTLIDMFEKDFLSPLNASGMHVVGTFRDLDDPDRFAWVRGFPDMAARPQALSNFYDGALWKSKRNAANATILDSDNVLLLKPATPHDGYPVPSNDRNKDEIIGATIHYLANVDEQAFVTVFEREILPRITELGAKPIARLITEESPNNFPRLPVRDRDRVFVWFARWPNLDAEASFASRFAKLSGWRDSIPEPVLPALMRKPERLRLAPTTTSELR